MTSRVPAANEPAALVARIGEGDEAAEERLVQAFSARVRMMVRSRMRGSADEADLSQEILMAAIAALRRGQLRDADKLGPFIAGIARNIVNNQLRTQSARPAEQPLEDRAAVADFRDEIAQRDRVAMVKQALASVGAEDRRILWMTLVDGLKPGEIAVRTGMGVDAVKARKSRALKKVAERLQGRR
jgi:RNA polymerase sigma factor (sigma-70 family)